MKENIYGYHGNKKIPFLKITVSEQKMIAKARRLLETGAADGFNYTTYESNIDFEVCFSCCMNLHFPNGKFRLVDSTIQIIFGDNGSVKFFFFIIWGHASWMVMVWTAQIPYHHFGEIALKPS